MSARVSPDRYLVTLAFLTLLLTLAVSCRNPEAPHQIVTRCRPLMVGGVIVPGDSVCEWLDLTTGQGGPGRQP